MNLERDDFAKMKKYVMRVLYVVAAKDMKSAIDKVENNVRLSKKHKDIEYRHIMDIEEQIPRAKRFSAKPK